MIVAAIAFTLFAWWFSTGAILYLDGLPRRTFPWTMLATTVLLGIALAGLQATADDTRVTGAFLAFGCALMVWAWQEVAFLLGYVTGPRRVPADPRLRGVARAWQAFLTIAWHEVALLALGAAVVALTWDGANRTGLWTFAVLWTMRLSAKLNVFLGVRNLGESFLPTHLAYLHTYFRRRRFNPLMAVSLIASAGCAMPLWRAALQPDIAPFESASLAFVATLLTLAIVEHVFMVLPLPSERLWTWGLRSRVADSAEDAADAGHPSYGRPASGRHPTLLHRSDSATSRCTGV